MSPPPATAAAASDFDVVQEDDAVASRKVSAVMTAGVVITIASVAISGWIVRAITGRLQTQPITGAGPAPRQIAGIHQTMIERDRHGLELRDRQRQSLDEYRWVDRSNGIVQVPIERAIQMVVEEASRDGGTP
jgi:hypothetical protein